MQYNYDYFISYSHADNKSEDGRLGFVDEFVNKLQNSKLHRELFGGKVSVFFDTTEIHSMSDWDNRIRSSLAHSRFFIALLSPNYFKSRYCAKEFNWWMQHEMHRRILGEGTAPMRIVSVNDLYNSNVDSIPDIPKDLQTEFPNWVKQLRQIQSGSDFDMRDLERTKIDKTLQALCLAIKDKVFKQNIAEQSPINANYPKYNENFVGRRENLRFLRKNLSESNTTAISAVNGLGGIGKSELALTYGHAFAWDYELGRVFAKCENKISLEKALLSSGIAEMHGIELKGTDEQQLTFLYNVLKRKIKGIEQRNIENGIDKTLGAHILIILDNVNLLNLISQEKLDKIPDFFHVIITTRESFNDFPYIHTELVDRLSEDESVELLSNLRSFGIDPQEAIAARKIAKLLDGFTLVVELTGAFLKRSPRVTYQKQFERLKADISDTMQTMVDKTQNLRRHQAECISKVLESTISALSSNARKALNFAAHMSPDAVALGWIPEFLDLDEVEGWEVIDELTGYCLLTPLESEPNLARIHRLVAETVKQDISEETQKEIVSKIRKKCNELLENDKTFWYSSKNSWNITPVSEFCMILAKKWTEEISEEEIDWNLTWMLNTIGNILNLLGKMINARDMFDQLFEIAVKRRHNFPSNVGIQRDLSISFGNLGDFSKNIGNTLAAQKWYEKALEIHKRLIEIIPNEVWIYKGLSVLYNRFGDLEIVIGNTATAREMYIQALEISQQLANIMPDDVSIQQDLIASYEKLGILEKNVGNLSAARRWCEKALEIEKRHNEIVPENIDVQRELSVSYSNFGDFEKANGNIKTAREWYEKAMKTCLSLSLMLPENVQNQQNLSASYGRLSDLEKVAGNRTIARDWCEKALVIDQNLSEKMPYSVDVQRNLGIRYQQLGDLEKDDGNTSVARELFKKAQESLQRVIDITPEDVFAQRVLSFSLTSLGDLERDSGNIDSAREEYKKALIIRQYLAEKTPENLGAQRDLGRAYVKLGDLEFESGRSTYAKTWFEKALVIDQRLVKQMPTNVGFQRNLSALYDRLSQIEETSGNTVMARTWFENALKIKEQLAELMPESVDIKKGLCASYLRLGDFEIGIGKTAIARTWYEKSLYIAQVLAKKMPEDIWTMRGLVASYLRLGDLERDDGNITDTRMWYDKALIVLKRVYEKIPEDIQAQRDLIILQTKLAQIQK